MDSATEIVPLFGQVIVSSRTDTIGRAPSETGRMNVWSEAFELWLRGLRSDNTRRAYQKSWDMLLLYTEKNPWSIGKADVAHWVDQMRGSGLSECTVNQRIAAISSFYEFVCNDYTVIAPDGREIPLHNTNPASGRKLRKKVNPYGKSFALDEVQAAALLRAIPQNTLQGLRDFALFTTYLFTGKRNSEARVLTWGDFEESGGKVWYRWSGKGHTDEKAELPVPCWNAIKKYLKATGRLGKMKSGDYVFVALNQNSERFPNVSSSRGTNHPLSDHQVNDLLKKYSLRAGLDPEKMHVHILRHTAAYLRKKAGDDIETISSFLVHSSLAVTQIYMHSLEGKADDSWMKVESLLGLWNQWNSENSKL